MPDSSITYARDPPRWGRKTFILILRANTNFLNEINPIPPVQPRRKKYSPSRFPQISRIIARSHPLHEGRIAIVTDVGMGCGGRGSVGRETCSQGGISP